MKQPVRTIRIILAAVALAAVASAAAWAATTTKYSVTKLTLGKKIKPDYLADSALSPGGKTLYVANPYSSSQPILAIPVSRPTAAKAIKSPCTDPGSLAVAPSGKTLYVACWGAGATKSSPAEPGAVDAVTLTGARKVTKIAVSGSFSYYTPDGLAVSPNGELLFISNYGHDQVLVADLASGTGQNTVVGAISDPHAYLAAPGELALGPGGKTLYISDWTAAKAGKVIVANVGSVTAADPGAGTVTSQITDPNTSVTAGLAVTPSGGTLYVSDDYTEFTKTVSGKKKVEYSEGKTVSVVNLKTGKIVSKISGFVAPWGLSLSSDGKLLYVVSNAFSKKADGHISLVKISQVSR